MNKISWIISVVLLLSLAGCRAGRNEPSAPTEGTVIASVTAYNEAKLTGDVWRRMRVTFDNTSHSSGRISEGNTAVMTLKGVPEGWITNVTVWMRSNKNSGAGSLSVIVGDSSILSMSGTFAEWVGRFADSNQPISTGKKAWKYSGQDIVLTVVGEVNSLYLDRMEISYSDHQPVYPPDTLQPSQTIRLVQDTDFVSGEYALVCNLDDQYLAAKGGWIGGKYLIMDSISAVVNSQTSLVEWEIASWPVEMRYTMTFSGDSVLIYNVDEREYIGHNTASSSKNAIPWNWKKAANGSIYIYHDLTYHEGSTPQLSYWQGHSFYPWIEGDLTVARYMYIIWDEQTTYWKLLRIEE